VTLAIQFLSLFHIIIINLILSSYTFILYLILYLILYVILYLIIFLITGNINFIHKRFLFLM